MKDMDELLRRSAPQGPRRGLTAEFTGLILERVSDASQRQRVPERLASALRGVFTMHKLTKPAVLGLGIAAATLTGSALAAVLWLQPHASLTQDGVTTLANGNKRFWVATDSCQGQGSMGPGKGYYEIKAGSKLTPEQLTKQLEASCESDLLPQLFPHLAGDGKKEPAPFKPGDKQYYTPLGSKFEKTDGRTVTLSTVLNGETYQHATLPLASNLKVYEKGKAISLNDLKPGDNLTLVIATTALDQPYSTETMSPDDLAKLSKDGFPIGSVVEGIIKRQYDEAALSAHYSVMGEDWTRLVEDKNSADGWRQLVPFDHNYNR